MAGTPAAWCIYSNDWSKRLEQPDGEGREQGRASGREDQTRRLSDNLHKFQMQVR